MTDWAVIGIITTIIVMSMTIIGVQITMFIYLLRRMDAMHGEFGEEFRAVRQEFGAVRQEIGAVRQEFGTVRQEFGAVRQEIGAVRQEISAVRQEIGAVRQEIGAVRQEVSALAERVARLEGIIIGRLEVGNGITQTGDD